MTRQEQAQTASMVGQVLRGKYRIDALLGAGGMATVYAATHRNGRRVAIKLLHPDLAKRDDIRERFVREGQAANLIAHPGVAAILDDDVTAEGAPFLVLELLAGHSVEELWEKGGHRLPAKQVLGVARDLCDVLVVAHERGVVHRDLKPANLFMTNDDRLKVLDFGIASLRDLTSERLTATGSIFGTPAFLPPEQAAGMTSQIDGRTDLWAVGAAMFTLLSGQTVHQGETAQHTTILSATTRARSIATARSGLHPAVIEIVDRALQFDKADRFQSAADMRDALSGALARLDFDALAATCLAEAPPKVRTLVAESDSAPMLGMAATVAPIAYESARPAKLRRFVPHALVGIGAAILIAGLGRNAGAKAAAPDMAFNTPAAAVTASAPVEAAATTPMAPMTPATPIVAPVPVVTASPEPAAVPTVTTAKIPARAPAARPAKKPEPARAREAAAAAAAVPDCTPPYVIENGKTKWKTECL